MCYSDKSLDRDLLEAMGDKEDPTHCLASPHLTQRSQKRLFSCIQNSLRITKLDNMQTPGEPIVRSTHSPSTSLHNLAKRIRSLWKTPLRVAPWSPNAPTCIEKETKAPPKTVSFPMLKVPRLGRHREGAYERLSLYPEIPQATIRQHPLNLKKRD